MNDLYKELIEIKDATDCLEGTLEIPPDAIGVVAFVHGGDYFSQHNNYVAEQLHKAHIGTLFLNLLTKTENRFCVNRFNFDLLTQRLNTVCRWLEKNTITATLPLGLFGTRSGAAAVLQVAATYNKRIAAIVVHEGRLIMSNQRAKSITKSITSPTLFIVDGCDREVLATNRRVYFLLNCKKKLEIVPGAIQLFEERGAVEKVAELTSACFLKYMDPPIFDHHFIK